MKRRYFIAMGVSLFAASAVWSLSWQHAAPMTTATAASAATAVAGRAGSRFLLQSLLAAVGNTTRDDAATGPTMATAHEDSLRDTEIDGDIRQDGYGRLIVDRGLRRSFDYFLQHVGEKSGIAIRAELAQWLSSRQHLSELARQEALVWFDKYIEVQEAGVNLGIGGDPGAAAAVLDTLQALRRQRLGTEVATAWFGDEEEQDRQTLARLRIAHDATLDDKERARELRQLALKDHLPGEQQDLAAGELAMRQSEEMDHAHLDAESRLRQRTSLWGEAAAQRLAALDSQQADWNNRLADYARQRAVIENDNRLGESDRNIRLHELLQAFDAPEQRRLAALAQAGLLPR